MVRGRGMGGLCQNADTVDVEKEAGVEGLRQPADTGVGRDWTVQA